MRTEKPEPGASRVPAEFGPLFWDCNLATLDVDRHRDQIIERVLQDGDLESVRWVLGAYGDEGVRRFVVEHGPRRLDPKILTFWFRYYGLGEPPCATRSSLIGSERGWRY